MSKWQIASYYDTDILLFNILTFAWTLIYRKRILHMSTASQIWVPFFRELLIPVLFWLKCGTVVFSGGNSQPRLAENDVLIIWKEIYARYARDSNFIHIRCSILKTPMINCFFAVVWRQTNQMRSFFFLIKNLVIASSK